MKCDLYGFNIETSSLSVNSLKGNSSISSKALIIPILISGIPDTSDIQVLKEEPHQTFFLDLCVYMCFVNLNTETRTMPFLF